MSIEILASMIRRQKPDCDLEITAGTRLDDLGLTSLDMIILACELERIHRISLTFDSLKTVETVGNLCEILKAPN